MHRFTIGVLVLICLLISTVSYVGICRIVRRHQIQIYAQQQAVQSSDAENNITTARLKRSAMNTFVFFIALIICYLPMFVVLTLQGLSLKDWQTEWGFADTAVCHPERTTVR